MNTEGIEFSPENGDWRSPTQAVVFYALVDDNRIKCTISRTALTDYFETEDTKEKALELFDKNRDRINRLAERLIQEDRFNENGEIFIKYDDCNGHGL